MNFIKDFAIQFFKTMLAIALCLLLIGATLYLIVLPFSIVFNPCWAFSVFGLIFLAMLVKAMWSCV